MHATLQRKVIYGVSLLVLMLLLYFVGHPPRPSTDPERPGEFTFSTLGQYRNDLNLTEAQMGELDPASTTAKLATFGMRGVAIALLWHQAEEKKKRHAWNDVVALGYQITFLEPHFVSIWDFLGWTLAYNASADFDDYRERYRWVIRGIDFLLTGLKKNEKSPVLHKKVGWTVSQKIGIADEVEQYRRLLRDDDDFGGRHGYPLPSDRDNWLMGRDWYHLGEALVRSGISLGNESDPIYFANSRLNLFNYAKWKRRDGIFGQEAIDAWNWALDEWKEFGTMELNTAIPVDGKFTVLPGTEVHKVIMNTTDIVKEEEKELLERLYNIAPGLKKDLVVKVWAELGEADGQQGTLLPLLEKADSLTSSFYPVEELQMLRQWLDENEPDWRTRLTADRNSLIPADQAEMRKIPSVLLAEDERAEVSKTDGEIAQIQQRVLGMLQFNPARIRDEIQELNEVPIEQRRSARAIVAELDTHPARLRMSNLFRGILNYESRFREVAVQTSQQADEAQELRYNARAAYYDGRLADSLNGWLDAMRKWDELLDIEEFKDRATDGDFVREQIDIAEKLLIILDDSNKIFSDVSGDPVPLHRLMWYKMFQEDDTVANLYEALEYAKKEYERALAETDLTKRREGLERAESYFLTITQRFNGINHREKFMEYAPFFEFRDSALESVALYIRSLESQGKPLPEPMILRSYIELMLAHDPAVVLANEILIDALPLVQEEKYEEALVELDRAVSAWQAILVKYPIIAHDSTNSAYHDIVRLAVQYVEVLRLLEKPMPEDFPFRSLLR